MRKFVYIILMGFVLSITSCGDQHKAQSLVKDFLNENLVEADCSYKSFSKLTPTAMINFDRVKIMRQEVSKLPYVKNAINYHDSSFPDTLLYIRTNYELEYHNGKKHNVTQTFYFDKALSRVIAFKEN